MCVCLGQGVGSINGPYRKKPENIRENTSNCQQLLTELEKIFYLELQIFFYKFSIIGIIFVTRISYISKESHAKKYICFGSGNHKVLAIFKLRLGDAVSIFQFMIYLRSKYVHKEIPPLSGNMDLSFLLPFVTFIQHVQFPQLIA